MTTRARWSGVAALLAAAILWYAWHAAYDHDEVEHLHAAWLVSQGLRPFTDFLEQHHPTLWYLLAPAVRHFSSPHTLVFSVRLFDAALLALLLGLTWRVLRLLWPEVDARWPLLLLVASYTFTGNSLEVRPDPLMNLLGYLGLLAWLRHVLDGRLRHAALAGLCFGLSAVVLQKALVFLGLVAGASLGVALLHRHRGRRLLRLAGAVALLLLCAAAPLALFFLWVRSAGLWDDFFFWNYRFNRFFYLEAALSEHFSIFVMLAYAFLLEPVLWIAGAAGMAAVLSRSVRSFRGSSPAGPREDGKLLLVLLALGYLLSLSRSRFPFDHYLIVCLPLFGCAAAEAFASAGPRVRAVLRPASALMALELLVVILVWPSARGLRDLHRLLLDRTDARTAIFAPPPYHPILRRDGAFFWYNGSMIGRTYADFCRTSGCDGRFARLEAARWAVDPARYVYLDREHPSYGPYLWDQRRLRYRPSFLDGLFELRGP